MSEDEQAEICADAASCWKQTQPVISGTLTLFMQLYFSLSNLWFSFLTAFAATLQDQCKL